MLNVSAGSVNVQCLPLYQLQGCRGRLLVFYVKNIESAEEHRESSSKVGLTVQNTDHSLLDQHHAFCGTQIEHTIIHKSTGVSVYLLDISRYHNTIDIILCSTLNQINVLPSMISLGVSGKGV